MSVTVILIFYIFVLETEVDHFN